MAEKNIKLTVQYKGTAFAGWQIQDSQKTVQGEITEAIFKTTSQRVNLLGAGRTDAGVHALAQTANFRIEHELEPERYRDALNYYLDDDIIITESCLVEHEFHARFDARFRRYRYLLSTEQSALYRDLRWEYRRVLTFERLQRAAEIVIGEHDFTPFCVVSSRKDNNICHVKHSKWRKIGPLWVYEIRGNRFLHSMVRSLVGAMVNLADKNPDNNLLNLTLEHFSDIINSQAEERVTFTAPARGLYLVSVGY